MGPLNFAPLVPNTSAVCVGCYGEWQERAYPLGVFLPEVLKTSSAVILGREVVFAGTPHHGGELRETFKTSVRKTPISLYLQVKG